MNKVKARKMNFVSKARIFKKDISPGFAVLDHDPMTTLHRTHSSECP